MTIQAIETHYAGHRFRSRLEARWAVFLNHLDVPWAYEPQGYVVNGTPYLPDFLVWPNTDMAFWLEIKGACPNDDELAKARGLAEGSGITAYVYWGKPEAPAPDLSHLAQHEYCGFDRDGYVWTDDYGWREYPTQPPAWQLNLTPTAYRFNANGKNSNKDRIPNRTNSGFWWWADCPHCGRALIKINGQIGYCPTWDGRDWDDIEKEIGGSMYPRFAHRTPRLLAAYEAARTARFEHGERG
jgi:hypothetical protein